MKQPSFLLHRTSRLGLRLGAGLALASTLLVAGVQAQTLRIGLAEDPDVLDPTMARSFVGRIVFASLCDKLIDIDEKLNIVPQLATSWVWSPDNKILIMKLRPGVTFHDGEKFDAAGKFIRRYVPELKNIPDKFIHAPWTLPPLEQTARGCVIGKDYPAPVVDHATQRDKALAMYKVAR